MNDSKCTYFFCQNFFMSPPICKMSIFSGVLSAFVSLIDFLSLFFWKCTINSRKYSLSIRFYFLITQKCPFKFYKFSNKCSEHKKLAKIQLCDSWSAAHDTHFAYGQSRSRCTVAIIWTFRFDFVSQFQITNRLSKEVQFRIPTISYQVSVFSTRLRLCRCYVKSKKRLQVNINNKHYVSIQTKYIDCICVPFKIQIKFNSWITKQFVKRQEMSKRKSTVFNCYSNSFYAIFLFPIQFNSFA